LRQRIIPSGSSAIRKKAGRLFLEHQSREVRVTEGLGVRNALVSGYCRVVGKREIGNVRSASTALSDTLSLVDRVRKVKFWLLHLMIDQACRVALSSLSGIHFWRSRWVRGYSSGLL
jgi:hypothetical protein